MNSIRLMMATLALAACVSPAIEPAEDNFDDAADRLLVGDWTLERNNTSLLERPARALNFGRSVALSADGLTMVVGDHIFSADGTELGARGSIHRYVRTSTSARFEYRQTLSGPSTARCFGSSVALNSDGRVLLVGDYKRARVYAYERRSTAEDFAPEPLQTLSGPRGSLHFGLALSARSNGLEFVVGDPGGGRDSHGAVHRYRRSSHHDAFELVETITDNAGSKFGAAVAFARNGLVIAVGDDGYDQQQGRVLIYARASSSATFGTSAATSLDLAGARGFGSGLALSPTGSTMAVGEWVDGGNGDVYIYALNGSNPAYSGMLSRPSESRIGTFGVAISFGLSAGELYVADTSSHLGAGPGRGVVWRARRR